MKIVKPNLFLQLVAIPAFLISDFILARYYPDAVLKIYPLNWIFLVFTSVCVFLPQAHRPLSNSENRTKRFKLWQWFSLIVVFELSLVAAWRALAQLINLLEPTLGITPAILSSWRFVVNWGFLPWTAMISLGVLIAYYTYIKNKDTSLCDLMFPLFRSPANGTLGVTANVCARLNTALAMAGTFLIAAGSLFGLITHWLKLAPLTGFTIENMLGLTLVLVILTHGKLGGRLFEALLKTKCSAFVVWLFALLMLVALLVLNSWLFKGGGLHKAKLPQWLDQGVDLRSLSILLMVVWALSWSVIGGIFLAYVSKGYTLFQLIFASLITPISLVLLGHYENYFSSDSLLGLGAIASMILLYLFNHNRALLIMSMQVYLAADDSPKTRSYVFFILNRIRIGIGLVYLCLIGGVLILALTVVSYVVPSFIYLLMAIIASGICFLRAK